MTVTITKETRREDCTNFLAGIKNLRKRAGKGEHNSVNVALQVAASAAIDFEKDAFVIAGNSYGHAVLNVYITSIEDAMKSNLRRNANLFRVTQNREVFEIKAEV